MTTLPNTKLPGWVTEQSMRYLAHTEAGRSIRDLARDHACHPSTILRQIRRMETRRDDPLVDEVLKSLGRYVVNSVPARPGADMDDAKRKNSVMSIHSVPCVEDHSSDVPSDADMAAEAPRVLRRLCETGAVLALASDMDKAVVVRNSPSGGSARTAVVDRRIARAMALNEWISCQSQGRITRYTITQAGRTALSRMMAEEENKRAMEGGGFAEAQAGFVPEGAEASGKRSRHLATESPLSGLARRKDPGRPAVSARGPGGGRGEVARRF